MLEQLFGSKTRLKMMRVFFREPEKSFYVRELTRALDCQINAVRRELELLIKVDILKNSKASTEVDTKASSAGLRKYYILNTESILYPELQALLLKGQVLGERRFINELKSKAGDIKLFLLTGCFTNDKRAPSDVLLIGDIKERTVSNIISKYEKEFGFPIRYTTMKEQEFCDRQHVMDKFLFSLFEADNVVIIDLLDKRRLKK